MRYYAAHYGNTSPSKEPFRRDGERAVETGKFST